MPPTKSSPAVRALLHSSAVAVLIAAVVGYGGVATRAALARAAVPPPVPPAAATRTPATPKPSAAGRSGRGHARIPAAAARRVANRPSPTPEPGPTRRPVERRPSGHARSAVVSAMTFNICGAVCRDGEVPDTAAHVVRRVLDGDLDVAFLQEVCRGQFQRIKASLRKKGYTALFARTAADARCDGDAGHGKGFGVALLVRGEAGRPVRLALPVGAGYERRSMLGATATIGGRTTFVASVHASPSVDAGRDAQLDAVARYLDAKAPMPTIVGGDFNTLPGDPAMARFYAPRAGGTGRYVELDELRDGTPTRSGRPTYNTVPRKIDYIFFSGAHFRTPRANVIRTSMSDHSVYLGGVRTVRD